jgi:N utilization substance protein A
MSELGGERIDIIEWSEDATSFIKEALSPASVLEVELNEDEHRATVSVSEDQQSLAIGRGGQNVRLAAKLTGWNIDINSVGGTESFSAPSEETTDVATDETVEKADAVEDMDPAVAAGIDPTESESVITEDDAENNTLSAEEETTRSEETNESIVDEEESRDK